MPAARNALLDLNADPGIVTRNRMAVWDVLDGVRLLPLADSHFPAGISGPYALVTLHRPSNVDDLPWLRELLDTLANLSESLHVIFPVHPRTRQRLETLGPALGTTPRLRLLEPLPYLEFLALQHRASIVITDSGGIQEETTFLGVPCLTVRENTERPITITQGTNQLVGRNLQRLRNAAAEILRQNLLQAGRENLKCVPLWDGHAAHRIAEIILPAATVKLER